MVAKPEIDPTEKVSKEKESVVSGAVFAAV